MGILYGTCFFISIIILLNLALFIYNKFREAFVCKNKPAGFSLNPTDNKNKDYLKDQFGGREDDTTHILGGDGKKICKDQLHCGSDGPFVTIGDGLKINGERDVYSCERLIDITKTKPPYQIEGEYNVSGDKPKIYDDNFQFAIKTACDKSLCNQIKKDGNITNFGINKRQQQDNYDINDIISRNHQEPQETNGLYNIWNLGNGGVFSVHGEDINTKWQPSENDHSKFFSQTSGIGKQSVNFKRIIDGRDKLIAWTNDAGKSDLFTCKKPCDGTTNIWNYDPKTNIGNNKYNIIDMTSDNKYNWMINSFRGNNYISKKLNNGGNYLVHNESDYLKYFSNNKDTIKTKRVNDIYWYDININRNNKEKYKPIQVTNNNNYVIILSHTDTNIDENGIYICKKPCTGEIYNWHKILNDRAKDIQLIKGDFSDNILWYIKMEKLYKLELPNDVPTESTMFSEGYIKQNISKEGKSFTIRERAGSNVKSVYGGHKDYLWVIFSNESNYIYAIDRASREIKIKIKNNNKGSIDFIVEEHSGNKPQQQKCSSGFSKNGGTDILSCSELTNNESSRVNTDKYCAKPNCEKSDFKQCCTFNQKCQEKMDENVDFCKIGGMTEFKSNLENLYCAGEECQKTEKEKNGKPHKDVFLCCKKPNNTCSTDNGFTLETVMGSKPYSTKYSNLIDHNNNSVEPWERNKFLNLMDYATKEWKKNSSGGLYREPFTLTQSGEVFLNKVKEQEQLNSFPDNIDLTDDEKQLFLTKLLKESNQYDYNNLDSQFKIKKTCTGWRNDNKFSCPIDSNKKLKENETKFFDGEKKVDKILGFDANTKNNTINFCCECVDGKYDNGDTCVPNTVCGKAGADETPRQLSGASRTVAGTCGPCADGYKAQDTPNENGDCVLSAPVVAPVAPVATGTTTVTTGTTGTTDTTGTTTTGTGTTGTGTTDTKSGGATSGGAAASSGTATTAEAKAGFRNMEGFSGFTREDWAKAQNYIDGTSTTFEGDGETNAFLTKIKTAKNHDFSNIPCTKPYFADDPNLPDGPTNWSYQKSDGGDKYCPPFQPICQRNVGESIGFCTGNLDPPQLKTSADKSKLDKYSDKLGTAGYCTGVFSNCAPGGSCDLGAERDTWSGGTKYDEINEESKLQNTPGTFEKNRRTLSSIIRSCQTSDECGPEWDCLNSVCVKRSLGGQLLTSDEKGHTEIDHNFSKLSAEERRIRNITHDQTEKLKQNHYGILEEGSLKKHNLKKGGIKGDELKTNSFRNSIDVLKTKYIWNFKLPLNVILNLVKLPYLDEINLGLKKFLIKTKERDDVKKAIIEGKGDIKISYNRRAIVTALYKLSKKPVSGVRIFEYIDSKWIEERSFKAADSCSGGVCSGDLTLKDLNTEQIPWGYKSRKAFEKKAPETTNSWNKLGDTSDVGKHLYGNTEVRNIFNQVNPHPHQNDFIFLKN